MASVQPVGNIRQRELTDWAPFIAELLLLDASIPEDPMSVTATVRDDGKFRHPAVGVDVFDTKDEDHGHDNSLTQRQLATLAAMSVSLHPRAGHTPTWPRLPARGPAIARGPTLS